MDISNVLISEKQIKEKVIELGQKIEKDYKGQEIFLIGVLKGASVFISDLMRCKNIKRHRSRYKQQKCYNSRRYYRYRPYT